MRSYLMAGLDHLATNVEMARALGIANEPTGVDPTPLLRALFTHLDAWVANGVVPPASRIPSLAAGAAVSRESVLQQAAHIPGIALPDAEALPRVPTIDLGPEADSGIGAWPAVYSGYATTVVSAVDDDCNEVAGIRMPEQQAPVATLTGWNTQRSHGRYRPLSQMPGSRIPFAPTREARMAAGDPRPSLAERYRDRDDYRQRIAAATDALIVEGFILAIDRDFAIQSAMQHYDDVAST